MSGRDGGSIGMTVVVGRCQVLISAKSRSRKSPPAAAVGRKLGRLVFFRGAIPLPHSAHTHSAILTQPICVLWLSPPVKRLGFLYFECNKFPPSLLSVFCCSRKLLRYPA